MITRTEKEAVVNKLKKHIDNSRALFLTNLIGVSSNDSVEVRKKVREAQGTMVVTRNTLFARAAKGTKAEGLLSGLKGPNAVAFAFEDSAAVAKAIYDASKDFEDIVGLNGGLLGEKELSKEELIQLAKLPSREQMLATLLATFNAPISAFVRVLFAIQEQKEAGAPAPAVTEEAKATEEAAPEAEAKPETAKGDTKPEGEN